ncbi:MAG: HAMP domain-containing histidine kinase [Gammaproteobacteria bacterium]|nr:HAMP domain-containing histidine kinase [Gammaproteobacteria bacterium]
MRWPRPKSLHGFLLLGLAIIALPLLVAMLNATVQMRRLTLASQRLVIDSVQTTRLTQSLFSRIASLDRAARVYRVMGSATVLTAYREHDAALVRTLRELRGNLRGPETLAAADALERARQEVGAAVLQPDASGTRQDAGLQSLADTAARLAALSNRQIDADLRTLEEHANAERRTLFLEAALLVPLVLLAVVVFTLGLGRPLRQIDRAITELGSGKFSRAIVVSGPVDLERLARQLEWLRCRLLDLAQERNRFLRHMSHELKTPLANIREGTELLMDGAVGELDTGQREVTAILQENGIKLQRLIENLLSFSAWQSNSVGIEASEFRVRPLIKQVLENQQLTLVSQRVRLEVNVEDITLLADRGKLRLILENLLSNAIKYSPRGGVIHVRARMLDGDFVLEVADAGAGIPPEDRARIFDAFYTGRAPGGHVKGTGIGLSVVNEFVHVHRGTIEIVDGEFCGAHFRIRMPLRVAPLLERREPTDAAA